jgi:acyl carrier protein
VRLRNDPRQPALQVLRYDIALLAEDGELLAELDDFSAKRVGAPADGATSARAQIEAAPAPALPVAASKGAATERAQLVQIVRTLVAQRLRRAPDQIGEHAPLVRLGVDSLMAVELVRALSDRIGVKLHATLLFEATTISQVVDRLAQAQLISQGRP